MPKKPNIVGKLKKEIKKLEEMNHQLRSELFSANDTIEYLGIVVDGKREELAEQQEELEEILKANQYADEENRHLDTALDNMTYRANKAEVELNEALDRIAELEEYL